MKAMILAAGRGERMRPLTDSTPKPLLEVGGRALIEHPIAALAEAGVEEIVINLSWHGEQIRDFLGSGRKYGLKIAYSDEGPVALETGGGIHHALPLLGDEPFWLVNGDVYCDFSYPERSLAPRLLGHLLLVANPEHNARGDFALDDGIAQVAGDPMWTYSGISLLRPAMFASCAPGKFPLAPLLLDAMGRRRISGDVHRGRWVDVGTPERLRRLDAELTRGA